MIQEMSYLRDIAYTALLTLSILICIYIKCNGTRVP